MGDRLLEVRNLKTYFYIKEGELRAVDELSYTVDKGQFVSLVGESACGKSVAKTFSSSLRRRYALSEVTG
jgi:peptide/nickel transport system ATP-binding protein